MSKIAQIIVMEEKEISEPLREYDTCYHDSVCKYNYYPLPKGKVIIIVLIANSGKGWIWTTIRRWTPEKEQYYRRLVGLVVECEVTEA